jgi:hypothetical protein
MLCVTIPKTVENAAVKSIFFLQRNKLSENYNSIVLTKEPSFLQFQILKKASLLMADLSKVI